MQPLGINLAFGRVLLNMLSLGSKPLLGSSLSNSENLEECLLQ